MRELTADEKTMLQYFKNSGAQQVVFELPADLAKLFADPEQCGVAQTGLAGLGLLELGPEMSKFMPNRIRAAALSLDGVRFIAKADLG